MNKINPSYKFIIFFLVEITFYSPNMSNHTEYTMSDKANEVLEDIHKWYNKMTVHPKRINSNTLLELNKIYHRIEEYKKNRSISDLDYSMLLMTIKKLVANAECTHKHKKSLGLVKTLKLSFSI